VDCLCHHAQHHTLNQADSGDPTPGWLQQPLLIGQTVFCPFVHRHSSAVTLDDARNSNTAAASAVAGDRPLEVDSRHHKLHLEAPLPVCGAGGVPDSLQQVLAACCSNSASCGAIHAASPGSSQAVGSCAPALQWRALLGDVAQQQVPAPEIDFRLVAAPAAKELPGSESSAAAAAALMIPAEPAVAAGLGSEQAVLGQEEAVVAAAAPAALSTQPAVEERNEEEPHLDKPHPPQRIDPTPRPPAALSATQSRDPSPSAAMTAGLTAEANWAAAAPAAAVPASDTTAAAAVIRRASRASAALVAFAEEPLEVPPPPAVAQRDSLTGQRNQRAGAQQHQVVHWTEAIGGKGARGLVVKPAPPPPATDARAAAAAERSLSAKRYAAAVADDGDDDGGGEQPPFGPPAREWLGMAGAMQVQIERLTQAVDSLKKVRREKWAAEAFEGSVIQCSTALAAWTASLDAPFATCQHDVTLQPQEPHLLRSSLTLLSSGAGGGADNLEARSSSAAAAAAAVAAAAVAAAAAAAAAPRAVQPSSPVRLLPPASVVAADDGDRGFQLHSRPGAAPAFSPAPASCRTQQSEGGVGSLTTLLASDVTLQLLGLRTLGAGGVGGSGTSSSGAEEAVGDWAGLLQHTKTLFFTTKVCALVLVCMC